MEPSEGIDLLEREILYLYKTLAGYGYFMGDLTPMVAPWRIFEKNIDALTSEEVEPWVREGSLLLALTVLWGVRDGAHSLSDSESESIAAMVEALRPCSEQTEDIARTIDSIMATENTDLALSLSDRLYEKHIVGHFKMLTALAETSRPKTSTRTTK